MVDPATGGLATACLHLLTNTCNACLKPVNQKLEEIVSSCINLDTNLSSLSNSLRQLEAEAEGLKANVQVEEAQMRKCKPQVSEWQNKVSEVVIHAKHLVNYNSTDGGTQPGTCICCNLTPRRRLCICRDVTRALQDVKDLLDQGGRFKPPFTSPRPPEAVLLMPINKQTFGIKAVMKQMWVQFNDKHKTVIGLYGLGGVGKTTLLKCFSNELWKQNNEYKFQVVIMLEVANTETLNVGGMQRTIFDRLGVLWNEKDSDGDRATFLLQALTKKKFVVLLDDVWNKFELQHVGIPTPLPEDNGSKLIVASRKNLVCADMGATCPIEVDCLREDDPWKLFLSRLTDDVKTSVLANKDMEKNAKEIVNCCGGLPLAIDVIGSAFAVSDQPKEWEEAAAEMKQNPSSIEGVDYIFTVLKWSYDKLEDTEKKCFLYCTMFPDYGSIRHEQLIEYWVAEGLISPQPYQGYGIIKKLLTASLLQRSNTDPTSEVKMHQMIQKMGHQQTSTENKLLIKVGQAALKKEPDPQEWEEATRISLMCNDIKELSISPSCSNLLTLLLQNNPNLSQLGSKFFRFMPSLKVLDLSHTAIKVLPDCGTLGQLVYLNLSHTPIREVPKKLCSALVRLQYLNMSHTLITKLPKQLAKLEKLTHLNLSETSALTVIPHGTISKLFMLKFLNLYKSNYGVNELPDLNLEELGQLAYLGITIYSQQVFHKLTKSDPLARCTRGLSLSRCSGMKSIQLSEFKTIMHLTKLHIESCDQLEELIIDTADKEDSPKVNILTLANLPNFAKVSCCSATHRFQDLRDLTIHECPKLQHVSWVLQFESIERLVITECHGLQRVVLEEIESVHERNSSEAAYAAGGGNLLPKLRIMELKQLSSLESIGWRRGFICLESITVDQCSNLRQLSERNMYPKLKQICAEPNWWYSIAPEVKSNFEDVFIPIHSRS